MPCVYFSRKTRKAPITQDIAITNIDIFAVKSLMYGAADAPTVPKALTYPKEREVTVFGNN